MTDIEFPVYPKIESIFKRDPETKYKTFLWGEYATPEFELLADCHWMWTEKVDGTNIRVHWDGEQVHFGGRTRNAEIPKFLLETLQEMFPSSLMKDKFSDEGGITLFGEGYGAKIQKGGGDYIPDGQSFILFDIFAGNMWFMRSKVDSIADSLGIKSVPIVGTGTLPQACDYVKQGVVSHLKQGAAEGLVMTPFHELKDRRGQRIITKIKTKDFQQG